MTKKQFGIIFTLMALIVCVGVLSAKLNKNGLTDPTDFSQVLSGDTVADKKDDGNKKDESKKEEKNDKKDEQTLSTQDSFYNIRSEKEQQAAATKQQLNAIIADANTSQQQKDVATNELTEKTMLEDKEGRIELSIKNKGFEDALCFIQGNNVRVIVKANEVSDADNAVIQEIVEDISSISDVIIEKK
ncbi:SpoIIIAH-like family protein [Clostridium septicum]|uniref:SpoIIIAH-like family protein n=1 Tax=Clostridium septicum TaxID=1504 RepID=A0A9N7JNA8_CLOSE|nr:SpoIIIAH-like family protein [Clostridium septicum]AYE35643.1 stage III sporulation protein AH [Clostridium septicum]QAS61030.1 SpoIIIAH-like family protein [Clostridium septicum]UEC19692.1 SpoIIIAH-like family protein [Clostridium septicum]USS02247.1 SpoIIIAH-like family protein [Clostridium septicum]WLF70827.1 SpoIIIAH-like family protein [Clostridium septicum]